ncbi:hypothetical protein [Streptomyces sp. NPDC093060]|uniref:hypothetical protein n=1 Tax=Streptomyces sp. NPDC093060 TaxID=3366019 RepID=UPI0037F321E2
MPALTPDATRLLHHLTQHTTNDGTPIHYLNRGTWLIGDHNTAPDTALIELATADCIEYRSGQWGGTNIHVTPAGHATTQHAV